MFGTDEVWAFDLSCHHLVDQMKTMSRSNEGGNHCDIGAQAVCHRRVSSEEVKRRKSMVASEVFRRRVIERANAMSDVEI